MNKFIKYLTILSLLFYLAGCKPQAEDNLVAEEGQSQINNSVSAENVFNAMPDKDVVMDLISKNQIEYNPDLLNNPELLKKYTTEVYKALNLGIYGSDLSISNTFNKTQESLLFLKCVNILASDLEVSAAFDKRTIDRLESNRDNRDSLVLIVVNAFRHIDDILRSNNRSSTSALILSGCFIEGLYVSCKLAGESKSPEIAKAIIDQKRALGGLIMMLETVRLESDAAFLLAQLKDIDAAFGKASSSGLDNLQGLASISDKVENLRQKVVAG